MLAGIGKVAGPHRHGTCTPHLQVVGDCLEALGTAAGEEELGTSRRPEPGTGLGDGRAGPEDRHLGGCRHAAASSLAGNSASAAAGPPTLRQKDDEKAGSTLSRNRPSPG